MDVYFNIAYVCKAYLYFNWMYWMMHLNNHDNPSVTAVLIGMLLDSESEGREFESK